MSIKGETKINGENGPKMECCGAMKRITVSPHKMGESVTQCQGKKIQEGTHCVIAIYTIT